MADDRKIYKVKFMKLEQTSCQILMLVSLIVLLLNLCCLELVPATRFGAKPPHADTFVGHYKHTENMPGHISEKDRLSGKINVHSLQEKVQF